MLKFENDKSSVIMRGAVTVRISVASVGFVVGDRAISTSALKRSLRLLAYGSSFKMILFAFFLATILSVGIVSESRAAPECLQCGDVCCDTLEKVTENEMIKYISYGSEFTAEFDNHGSMIKATSKDGKLIESINPTYDENGKVKSQTHTTTYDGKIVIEDSSEYENGKKTSYTLKEYRDTGIYMRTEDYTYENGYITEHIKEQRYNDSNKEFVDYTQKVTYGCVNTDCTTIMGLSRDKSKNEIVQNTYDYDGNLKKVESYSYLTGEWLRSPVTAANCRSANLYGVCKSCNGSSFRINDGECDRIRYTPAEAAEVLHDDNTNEVTITFKM
jgi:hypothetical protein